MLKILIIDDEEDYCMILKSFFRQRNCEILSAYTIKEGLELLKTSKPDILFLDNNLPDGHGWQYVDSITTEVPSLRIYLVSAHKNKGDFKTNSPLITVWEKPISFNLLEEVVRPL